jgi:pyruvate formate lyase activating enzyme
MKSMNALHEARYYEPLADKKVLCTLCPHDCRIADGGRGVCAVRYNVGGKLYTLVYDRVVARNLEPIEKKPLFHFHPGSTAYSIATVGCCLRCAFCQNWQISQWPKEHLPKRIDDCGNEHDAEPICPRLANFAMEVPGEPVTPAQIVQAALDSGAHTIAYTFTEPTIFYELALDTARLAKAQGLKNVFVTSGYINEAPQRELAQVLDEANVDLKFFREESYRHISRVKLQPILDAIRRYRELGVWLEVTTLVIPGINDSDAELKEIADFLCALSPEIPWHISRFYPAHEMRDVPLTPVATVERAEAIGRAAGLRYVYAGNVPGEGGESTHCPGCGTLLIERYGFYVLSNRVREGRCPDCGRVIAGVGMDGG